MHIEISNDRFNWIDVLYVRFDGLSHFFYDDMITLLSILYILSTCVYI